MSASGCASKLSRPKSAPQGNVNSLVAGFESLLPSFPNGYKLKWPDELTADPESNPLGVRVFGPLVATTYERHASVADPARARVRPPRQAAAVPRVRGGGGGVAGVPAACGEPACRELVEGPNRWAAAVGSEARA